MSVFAGAGRFEKSFRSFWVFLGLALWPHADLHHVHLPALLPAGCCPLGHYHEHLFAHRDVLFLLRRLIACGQDRWLRSLGGQRRALILDGRRPPLSLAADRRDRASLSPSPVRRSLHRSAGLPAPHELLALAAALAPPASAAHGFHRKAASCADNSCPPFAAIAEATNSGANEAGNAHNPARTITTGIAGFHKCAARGRSGQGWLPPAWSIAVRGPLRPGPKQFAGAENFFPPPAPDTRHNREAA